MADLIKADSSCENPGIPPIDCGYFQQTIEVSPEAIFWLTEDGKFYYVNNKACESTGYSKNELLSMFLWDLDPDFSKEYWQSHWEKLNKVKSINIETRHRRKDGVIFPVEVYANHLDFNGTIFHTAFVRDISEYRRAETVLRESENRFRALLDTIPDLVWLKDSNGVFLSCNAMVERLFCTKEENIIGKTDYDFVDKELADLFRYHDRLAMHASKPTTNEEWVTFPDTGEKSLLLTTKVPMRGSSGNIIGVLGIARDITELRKAEEERLKLESELHQAQKIESIGQLAGGIAHDFNNMLGVILGHSELALLKKIQPESVEKNIQEIKKAATHSAELTRQLLTFARKQTISPKVINLNETIPGMLTMLQRFIGENIQLSLIPGPNLWPIKVDSSQADQILANLCVNARDAIGENGNICISTKNITFTENLDELRPYDILPGDYVQIAVSDDGCGIEKEILEHIFEPFFTTKGIGSGTGLGLATVYGAVKQNNGFIDVRSESGIGTTFNIFFPREVDDLEQVLRKSHIETLQGNETILLVEDEEMLLHLEVSILEQCGYKVLPAQTVEKAIEIAHSHQDIIHLLVTDVIMPEMNGLELSQKLQYFRPGIKVLFLSGYSAGIIEKKGVLEEGVNFLKKPISMASLSQKIRTILD